MTLRFVIATVCLLAAGAGSANAIEVGDGFWRDKGSAGQVETQDSNVLRSVDCSSSKGLVAKRACEASFPRETVRADATYPMQRDLARKRELFRVALILGAFR